MKKLLKISMIAAGVLVATQTPAAVILYAQPHFEGRSFQINRDVDNLQHYQFNDRASSAVVLGNSWEVCEDAQFHGHCMVLRPGRYSSLSAMGLNNQVSSARLINTRGRHTQSNYAPEPEAVYDNHRRGNEGLYHADVTSAQAIFGPPEQHCWVEREKVSKDSSRPNVPGAVLGAVLGGVIGHQMGHGRGKDLTTVGGAAVGAAIGANAGRDDSQHGHQDVQHCAEQPQQAQPDYWDVTYQFHGQEHHIQTTYRPGNTITVNKNGEPRS